MKKFNERLKKFTFPFNMTKIFRYLSEYFSRVNKWILALCTLLSAILVYLNYAFGLENRLTSLPIPYPDFTGHYILFIFTFGLAYLFYYIIQGKNYFKQPYFLFLFLMAPAIFSVKMAADTDMELSGDAWTNHYWNQVLYWPVRVLMMTGILALVWYRFNRRESFYGLTWKNFSWRPYVFMLLFMIPLIAAASTQADFLDTYPKLKTVLPIPPEKEAASWLYKLIFELSYGSDFFSIELFFRGFLVLAFVKYAGKDAILPMACFYCTIHFGKPLGECISSYFGGILLGIVSFYTRSIYGGLIVHLGIAWLMELGGYLGGLKY